MRTVTRFGAFTLLVAVAVAGWWLGSAGATGAVTIHPRVDVSSASPKQLELARWAVGRFEAAGLGPPLLEIAFHADPSGCGGHQGFARLARVDVCTSLVNAMTRRTLLHEMSHIWLDQNVTRSIEADFLALRELPSWNAFEDPWQLRGYEQGAEIIAWALGERILTAQIPENDPTAIGDAFDLLTGRPLPEIEP